MAQHAVTREQVEESIEALHRANGVKTEAARLLGLSNSTYRNRLNGAHLYHLDIPVYANTCEARPAQFEIAPLPSPDISIDELVEHRIKQFGKKKLYEESRKLIPVKIKVPGSIGLVHFGDPHVDDDGTDMATLKRHVELVRGTPGCFGCNVGDTTNNWVGRLARLWEQQSTSGTQAWMLAEWFLNQIDWLYLIGGNHDLFSGTGDPIKWIQKGKSAPYMSSEVRLELQFPNKNFCRINARHDFAGHSQYNPAHGPSKAALFGVRDHLNIAGHKHISGHNVIKNPETGWICHCFLVAGYKVYDRFAMERGFRDQRISPSLMTVIDPSLDNTHPDFITHFWDIERGVDYLNYLRKGL